MTRATLTVLLIAAACSSASAQELKPSQSTATTPPHTSAVAELLRERIAEVDFQDAPLDQVIDWISSITQLNIFVSWRTLEDAGLERDKPITLAVRNIPLSQVLWLILEEAGGPDLKLAYQAQDNLVQISTEEDLGRAMIVKVYDVADLTVHVPDFAGAPHVSLEQSGSGTGAPFAGASSSRDPEDEPESTAESEAETIAEVIAEAIAPDSWARNGGMGTIQVYRDVLIVRNNAFVHQAIGGMVALRTDR